LTFSYYIFSKKRSLSCSCFRSCGVGTFVYRKWCFVLHVQCCGSCMVSSEYSTQQ